MALGCILRTAEILKLCSELKSVCHMTLKKEDKLRHLLVKEVG